MSVTRAPASEALRSPRARYALVAVACGAAALTGLLYLPALKNGFVHYDDRVYIFTLYAQLGHAESAWDVVRWTFSTVTNAIWHPLTWLSFLLNYQIWGAEPFAYHLTNLLLHAVNTGLTVLLAGVWFARRGRLARGALLVGAGLVGVLFGVHPAHVESTAWISGRKDLLYGLFWLLSLLAYTAYTSAASPRRRALAYVVALGCFGLATLSKAMAVTLPAVLLVLDWYPFGRLRRGTLLRVAVWEKVPFALLCLPACVMTLVAARVTPSIYAAVPYPLADRLWTAAWAPGFYLAKTLAPVHLVPLYPRPAHVSPLSVSYLAGYAIVIGMTAAGVRLRARLPLVTAAWASFCLMLLPVLGFARIAGIHAVADRYLYLALLAPLIVVGAGAAYAWEHVGQLRAGLVAGAALVVAWLAASTTDLIGIWKDPLTLWEYVVAETPPHSVPLYNLGHVYSNRGEPAKAADMWRRAAAAEPPFSPALTKAGDLAMEAGDVERAREYYERAVALDPTNALAQHNLGFVLEELGRMDEACAHYREFQRLAPPEYAEEAAQVAAKCP